MLTPRTEEEVRGFLGRLNYIAIFISHMTATCQPIFKLPKKDQVVKWNDDCQIAFYKIKEYLLEPSQRIQQGAKVHALEDAEDESNFEDWIFPTIEGGLNNWEAKYFVPITFIAVSSPHSWTNK